MAEDFYSEYNGNIQNAYQKQLSQLKKQQQEEALRLQAQADNQIRQYEAQKPVLKQRFTDNAQDAYVQKMQSLKELPQILSAQGYNGGLTESSNIKLDNQYGNAYNAHQRDYNTGLREVDNQVANTRASLSDMLSQSANQYGGLISNAEASYQQMLAQAAKEQRQYKLQEQARQDEFAYKQQQDKLANDYRQQQFNYQKQQSAAKSYLDAQSNAEKEQKAQIAAALKMASTRNFIDSIERYTPKSNIYDSRTGQTVTPDNQIEMALEMAISEGKLTQTQALAIAQKYGLTDVR